MTNVSTAVRVSASAEEVWDRIGAFDAVQDWHSAVQRVTREQGGMVRRVHLADGGESVERLVEGGEAGRSYSYELVIFVANRANFLIPHDASEPSLLPGQEQGLR